MMTKEEYCQSIACAKYMPCFSGAAALLPHRVPNKLPINWWGSDRDRFDPEALTTDCFVCSDGDEIWRVSPIPGKLGLVYVHDLCFVLNGEVLDFPNDVVDYDDAKGYRIINLK